MHIVVFSGVLVLPYACGALSLGASLGDICGRAVPLIPHVLRAVFSGAFAGVG